MIVLGAETGIVAVYQGTKYVVTTKTFMSQIHCNFLRPTLNSPGMILESVSKEYELRNFRTAFIGKHVDVAHHFMLGYKCI